MKNIFILLLSVIAFSCESIQVVVRSEKTASVEIYRHTPIVFSANLEANEALTLQRQCKRGLIFAGLKTDDDCEISCRFASVLASSEKVDAGQKQRSLVVSVFADRELKNKIFQANVSTMSEKQDVLVELCEAAFQAYPETRTQETFNINPRSQ